MKKNMYHTSRAKCLENIQVLLCRFLIVYKHIKLVSVEQRRVRCVMKAFKLMGFIVLVHYICYYKVLVSVVHFTAYCPHLTSAILPNQMVNFRLSTFSTYSKYRKVNKDACMTVKGRTRVLSRHFISPDIMIYIPFNKYISQLVKCIEHYLKCNIIVYIFYWPN